MTTKQLMTLASQETMRQLVSIMRRIEELEPDPEARWTMLRRMLREQGEKARKVADDEIPF